MKQKSDSAAAPGRIGIDNTGSVPARLGIHAAGLIGTLALIFFHPGAMDMDRIKGNVLLLAILPLAALGFGVKRFFRASCGPMPGVLFCAVLLCLLLVVSLVPALWDSSEIDTLQSAATGFLNPAYGIGMVALLLSLVVLAMAVRGSARGDHGNSRIIPVWLLCSGFATAVYALLQSAGYEPFYLSNPQRDPVSFLGNTNELAEVMALLIPMTLALVFDLRKPTFLIATAGLPLLVAALWVSGGRGGMLAALCGSLFFIIFLSRAGRFKDKESDANEKHPLSIKKRLLVIFGAAVLGLVIAAMVGSEQHLIMKKIESDASIFSADYPTNRARLEVWKSTASMIGDNPIFGSGPNRFRMAYPPYRSRIEAELPGLMGARTEVMDPHNEFLWAAAEGGLPGGVIFLIFCLLLIRGGIKAVTGAADKGSTIFRAGLAGSVLAFAVLCLFRSPLHNPATAVILFLLIGLLHELSPREESTVSPPTKLRRNFTLVGLCMLVLLSFWIGGRGLASDWIAASTAMREEIGQEEFSDFQRAADMDPGNIDIINFVGQVAANRLMGTSADKDLRFTREAEKRLAQVLALHPYHPGALKTLARVNALQGDEDKALQLLERFHIATGEPGLPEGTLADMLNEAGLYRESAEIRMKAAGKDEGKLLEQANTLFDNGDVEAALVYVDRHLNQNPLDGDALYLQGRCLKSLFDEGHDDAYQRMHIAYALDWIEAGDWEKAKGSLNRSLRYGEGVGEAFLLAAIIDAVQGEIFSYAASPPDNEAVMARLRQLAREGKLPQGAAEYLEASEQ